MFQIKTRLNYKLEYFVKFNKKRKLIGLINEKFI